MKIEIKKGRLLHSAGIIKGRGSFSVLINTTRKGSGIQDRESLIDSMTFYFGRSYSTSYVKIIAESKKDRDILNWARFNSVCSYQHHIIFVNPKAVDRTWRDYEAH